MTHVVFEREPGARPDAPPFTMPKPIGRMMVGLALLTIVVAGGARYFGVAATVQDLAPVVGSRALVLEDRPAGGIVVRDARTGEVLRVMASEDSARFLRTVVRGLGTRSDPRTATLRVPFTLAMRQDGQLTVSREGSPRVTSINGFGLTQVAALQELLVAGAGPR
jgi:putative photosynthetic complex assembly protein